MADTTFAFRVDDELKAAYAAAAKAEGRTEDELLRVLMQEVIARQAETPEYDAWFRAEVEAAIREDDDPRFPASLHGRARSEGGGWSERCDRGSRSPTCRSPAQGPAGPAGG